MRDTLIMMSLVVSGAIEVLKREENPSEVINAALYWLKFEIEDTLLPAAK